MVALVLQILSSLILARYPWLGHLVGGLLFLVTYMVIVVVIWWGF